MRHDRVASLAPLASLVLLVVGSTIAVFSGAGAATAPSGAAAVEQQRPATPCAAAANGAQVAPAPPHKVLLQFNTMYGVDGPFVGDRHPVRGFPGDELPWVIKSAEGKLEENGHLKLQVKGLVFADDPSVSPDLQGINDESQFRVVVSCLTEEGEDNVIERFVVTPGFPATHSGDASVNTVIALPNPCVAPVLLVLAGSEDKWFAVNGFEEEDEQGDR